MIILVELLLKGLDKGS